MPLPEAWQERFAAMVSGQAPLDGSWFTGSSRLSPTEQIAIYRRQYELRFAEALRKNFGGLASLPGGESWLDRYMALEPCLTWTLEGAGHRMVEFMAERGGPPQLVEMAALDRAVGQGFLAAEGAPLDPVTLMSGAALRLAPHVTLLRHRFDVHRWRSVALGGEQPEALEEGDFPLVIYRLERRMKHIVMPPAAFALLQHLHEGLNEALAAASEVDSAALQADVREWFTLFSRRRLVSPASPPASPPGAEEEEA